MNLSSVMVLAFVLALAAFAAWRTHKKGAPCECGGNRKCCGGGCKCHCDENN